MPFTANSFISAVDSARPLSKWFHCLAARERNCPSSLDKGNPSKSVFRYQKFYCHSGGDCSGGRPAGFGGFRPFLFSKGAPDAPPAYLKELKIKHLLSMTLGHDKALLMGGERQTLAEKDWIRYIFQQPVPYAPGTHFCYNNAGPYLAGVIVEKVSGLSLLDYLMPRLFLPLGISRPVWEQCPMGHIFRRGGHVSYGF